MSKADKAVELFNSGYNCAQAVTAAFSESYGITKEDIARMSAVFGGGIARTQGICGAVSGALMVLGLNYFDNKNMQESKALSYKKGQEYLEKFKKEKGSVTCLDLLGTDMAKATEQKLFSTVCVDLVKTAVRILEASV